MKNNLSREIFYFIGFSLLIFASLPISVYSQEAKIRIIKNNAVVRLKPNTESLVIRNLPLGAELEVLETAGEWIRIKLPPDKDGIIIVGYVHCSYVELTEEITKFSEPEKEHRDMKRTEAYYSWERQFAKARGKKSTGNALIVAGSLLTVASVALIFLVPKKEESSAIVGYWRVTATEKKVNPVYLISGGVGLLVDIVGIAVYSAGNKEANQLKKEGEIKGYLKAGLIPKYKAVGVQISVSF